MASASKLFAKAVEGMSCRELVHSERHCGAAFVWNFTQTFGSCCRYVFPIAIVRIRNCRNCLSLLSSAVVVYSDLRPIDTQSSHVNYTIKLRLVVQFTFYNKC